MRKLFRTAKEICRDRTGQFATALAFMLPAVLLAVGVAVDYTHLTLTASRLQEGADATALQFATVVANDNSISSAAAQANVDTFASLTFAATRSSYSGTATQSISSRDPAVVEVTLKQPQPLFFAGVLGMGKVDMERSATAISYPRHPVCLLVLDTSAANVWSNSGTSSVEAKKCYAQVNSKSNKALATNGNAEINTMATVVAGPNQTSAGFSPQPVFNQKPMTDPIARRVTWPTPSTCDYTNLSLKNVTKNLTPGTLCGGLTLGTDVVLNLSAGLYVIKSGNLGMSSGAILSAEPGTTIVLLDDTATINMQSGAKLSLTAPSKGSWKGIALAVKPQSVERTSSMVGGGDTELSGIVYLPTQKLALTGGGSMTIDNKPRIFVVNRIDMRGNGEIYLGGSTELLATDGATRLVN
jgi:Flp pilus assembly protein TadG